MPSGPVLPQSGRRVQPGRRRTAVSASLGSGIRTCHACAPGSSAHSRAADQPEDLHRPGDQHRGQGQLDDEGGDHRPDLVVAVRGQHVEPGVADQQDAGRERGQHQHLPAQVAEHRGRDHHHQQQHVEPHPGDVPVVRDVPRRQGHGEVDDPRHQRDRADHQDAGSAAPGYVAATGARARGRRRAGPADGSARVVRAATSSRSARRSAPAHCCPVRARLTPGAPDRLINASTNPDPTDATRTGPSPAPTRSPTASTGSRCRCRWTGCARSTSTRSRPRRG